MALVRRCCDKAGRATATRAQHRGEPGSEQPSVKFLAGAKKAESARSKEWLSIVLLSGNFNVDPVEGRFDTERLGREACALRKSGLGMGGSKDSSDTGFSSIVRGESRGEGRARAGIGEHLIEIVRRHTDLHATQGGDCDVAENSWRTYGSADKTSEAGMYGLGAAAAPWARATLGLGVRLGVTHQPAAPPTNPKPTFQPEAPSPPCELPPHTLPPAYTLSSSSDTYPQRQLTVVNNRALKVKCLLGDTCCRTPVPKPRWGRGTN